MARKVIITCAVTGADDTVAKNPAVPVTPEQIATSSIDAAKAGAAAVHIHVREPKTGKPLWKFDLNPKGTKWILGGRGTRNAIIATPVIDDTNEICEDAPAE